MPKKPDRPPQMIQFGPGSACRRITAPLPTEQTELENDVVKRFTTALRRRGAFDLAIGEDREEPSDAVLQSPTMGRVGVQIAELIDGPAIARAERATGIIAAVEADLSTEWSTCSYSITDRMPASPIPALHTSQGRSLVDSIKSTIKTASGHVLGKAKPVSFWPVRSTAFPDRFVINAVTDARWGPRGRVTWPSPSSARGTNELLLEVVENKVGKAYAPPPYTFWLLVYSVTQGLFIQDEVPARWWLDRARFLHRPIPFSQVWFLHLLPTHEGGLLTLVWDHQISRTPAETP